MKCVNDISNSFMESFNYCIGLRITSCNWYPFEAIAVLPHLGKFSHKFGTTNKHILLWKWVTSKPRLPVNFCDLCRLFIGYLCHLETACGRINHF